MEKRATFGSSFGLLSTGFIFMMVIGIFFVVGIDVGVNAVSGQFCTINFRKCNRPFMSQGEVSISSEKCLELLAVR